jgi:uncharacterized membrane protein (UPF0127 family)
MNVKTISVMFAGLLWSACGDSPVGLEQLELQIRGPSGELELDILAEVAASAEDRITGLSKHDSLAPDEGLLLIFPAPTRACIRNESVRFPIDAIFASAEQRVIAIVRDLPAGDPSTHCHDATAFVLELPAHSSHPVHIGDTLHPSKLSETNGF